jgi:hypothetical protein
MDVHSKDHKQGALLCKFHATNWKTEFSSSLSYILIKLYHGLCFIYYRIFLFWKLFNNKFFNFQIKKKYFHMLLDLTKRPYFIFTYIKNGIYLCLNITCLPPLLGNRYTSNFNNYNIWIWNWTHFFQNQLYNYYEGKIIFKFFQNCTSKINK